MYKTFCSTVAEGLTFHMWSTRLY